MPALVVPTLAEILASHPPDPASPLRLHEPLAISRICTSEDFLTRAYSHWCAETKEAPRWHRKQWEFVFIAQVLYERGLLTKGKRGLGFGVGREPLPALFAKYGAHILATDAPHAAIAGQGWEATNQWTPTACNERGICPTPLFTERVRFEACDMRAIPATHHGKFDFTWSSCCFEHLGGVEEGFRFLEEQGRCLTWGGIGVHTTELLLFSDGPSVNLGHTVIFSRADLETLSERLGKIGLRLVPVRWSSAREIPDRYIDDEPYNPELHLRLYIGKHIATSIGLIIVRMTPP